MKRTMFWAAMLFAAATVVACDKNGPEPPTPPVVTDAELSGAITENLTLDPTVEYTIAGSVNVRSGATLTIPAGMTIKAKKGFASYILVEQGGKININGTAAAPVTLTSAEASPKAGDWGGLIVNGRTPLTGGVSGSTEISSTIPYGGADPADNSGSITYLVLEYTGAQDPADDEVEHNGLTLNAVGSGTRIENVFIIDGMDDGIEFFGGTVDVKNLLVVNPDDDMFDFTFGYSGTVTNAYGVWEAGHTSGESDPSGVEADGNLDGDQGLGATPQSDFAIANMTIELRNAYDTDLAAMPKRYMQNALRVRRGAKATIANALVVGTGYVENFVNLSDGKGGADKGSQIDITNSLTGATRNFKFNDGDSEATYPGVAITGGMEAGNAGCPTDIFAWTGYEFGDGAGANLQRLLPMQGAYNVRDLGGYAAAGKTVKWRKVLRSGDLNKLTDADLAYLSGVKVIVDFRGDAEVESAPDKTPSTWRKTYRFPIEAGNIFNIAEVETTEQASAIMCDMNRYFVEECEEQYTGFFEVLMDEASAPMLFHCSAGKDRAGLASALFLASLGVDRETIIDDYMLSAEYVREKYADYVEAAPALGPIFSTERQFLQAAFDVIDTKYGGMDSFLTDRLGVDTEKMRRLYTE